MRKHGFVSLYEIEQCDFAAYSGFLDDLAHLHGSVAAVLNGSVPGRLWVDQPEGPTAILLDGPEGLYLGGQPSADEDYAALREMIPGWAYLYPSADWQGHLDMALPHRHFLRHERLYLAVDPRLAAKADLPKGLTLQPDPGGSLGHEILIDGVVAARTVEDLRVGSRIEIGVWTHPERRREGLANLVVKATLDYAAGAGVDLVGWHCLSSNRGSLAVAQKSGFQIISTYCAWSAKLPAENVGDLMPLDCRAFAEVFEKGRAEVGWLDFHAAEAWAQAGELGRAVEAIERLVAGGWPGQADWLWENWALKSLHGDPRFEAALAIQARK